jgi:arylsulfatase A-like enzyme
MANKPNIVIVITDHTSAHAVAGGSQCLTPHLDRIAAAGVRFNRCYTTNAICSPARASLMTGLYPSSHGMWDCTHTQRPEWVDVPAGRFPYFSQWLAQAGYVNGYFGKWHVEQSGKLEDFGWHEYKTDIAGARGRVEDASGLTFKTKGYRDYFLAGVAEDAGVATHPAFDAGLEFATRHSNSDRPFCCVVSTIEPHDPYCPPKRFFDMYEPDSILMSPSFRDECIGKPEVVRRMRKVYSGMTDSEWRFMASAYYATISYLDAEVGRLIDGITSLGIADDTIFLFTSDHGDMLGAHGLITKGIGTGYEEVYNIPLLMCGPGVEPSGDIGHVVSLVDVAPTVLDLCGVDPIEDVQGKTMRGILEGTEDENQWKDGYAEFFGQRFVYTQRLVWHDHWKYVFSPGGIDELYDLSADPNELVNLADDPECLDVLHEMVRRMWKKMEEIGDDSLYNTHYATLRIAPVGPNLSARTGSLSI